MRTMRRVASASTGDVLVSPGEGSFEELANVSSWRLRTAILIGGATLIRLLVTSTVGLTDTEAYYYSWSRFPSLSYYDHPPMVAWVIWLTTLASKSPLAIRLGSVICAALMGALAYRLAETLFSPRAGYFTVLILNVLPAFAVIALLANPESLLAPLWVLALLLLHDLSRHHERWRPIALGLAIGLAFLCKYTSILLLPLTLLYVAITPQARFWLRRPAFYLGGFVSLLTVLPVIVWNHQHGWPTLHLHLQERMPPLTLSTLVDHAGHFVVGQVFFFHPLIFPALLAALAYAVVRARREPAYRFLALASAPILLFFFVIMIRVSDAESHWPMVSYIAIAVAAAGWLDERLWQSSTKLVWYMRACLATSAIIAAAFVVHAETTAILRRVPDSMYHPSDDPINETEGWKEVSAAILARSRQAQSVPAHSPVLAALSVDPGRASGPVVVASSHNVLCGRIFFELNDRPPVYCVSPTRTEFDFIGRRDPPDKASVVYVDSDRYPAEVSELLPSRQCQRPEYVEVKRGGKLVNRYRMSVCGPKAPGWTDSAVGSIEPGRRKP